MNSTLAFNSEHNLNISNEDKDISPYPQYGYLVLSLFSLFTIFGNMLVILSVAKERSLQGLTNYLIVSLALADLFVALFCMPFGIYVLVSKTRKTYFVKGH